MLTLWDLLPRRRAKRGKAPVEVAAAAQATVEAREGAKARRPAHRSASRERRGAAADRSAVTQAKYDAMTKAALAEYGVRVRRWRNSMSGVAWEVHYEDGRVARLIEAPRPKGPMSAAIFLHEVGHHAIGFNRYKPRCLEEHYAWAWALREMERRGIAITERVLKRRDESMRYAVAKARRRGIKALPAEVKGFAGAA